MAEYLIQGETLTNLGDKIRVLSGTEDAMTPAEMANELDAVAEKMGSALFLEEGETIVASSPSSGKTYHITYGKGRFVAVAQNGASTTTSNVAAYSDDGITWIETTLPTKGLWNSVAYGNGRFVAVSKSLYRVAYSEDGVVWVNIESPISKHMYSIAYGNGKFVTLGYDSNIAIYSDDGITWTETTMPYSGLWHNISYCNDRFIALDVANKYTILYSYDGIVWEQTTLDVSVLYSQVAYGNGRFVVVDSSGKSAAHSDDGIIWTRTDTPVSAQWNSIAYGKERFVVVGNSSSSLYSDDGITWTETTLPNSSKWSSVAYGNGRFIAMSYDTTDVVYSYDGINWTNQYDYMVINDVDGDNVTEETVQATKLLDTELSTQDDLIAQIVTALEGKTAVGGGEASVETCSVTTSSSLNLTRCAYTQYIDGQFTSQCLVSVPSGTTIENVVVGSLLCAVGIMGASASITNTTQIGRQDYDMDGVSIIFYQVGA